MHKTTPYRVIDAAYYKRIIDTLVTHPIVVAVFDNTQIGCPQKNQRDGKSNLFLKMTAKLFVLMQYHWNQNDLKKEELQFVVDITFMLQIIISAYGMPCYELLTGKSPEFAIQYFDDDYYKPFLGADATGKRVLAFVDLMFISEEYKAQQRFLSRPNNKCAFPNAKSKLALDKSGLQQILQKNRSRGGLFDQANKFQRESVKKWKGNQKPSQLL
jgi:hypothetical protein